MTDPLRLKSCPGCGGIYRAELVDKVVILDGHRRKVCRGCHHGFTHQHLHEVVALDPDDLPDESDTPIELSED